MNLINFIVWLTSGAIIGWFASRMVMSQNKRRTANPAPSEEDSPATS